MPIKALGTYEMLVNVLHYAIVTPDKKKLKQQTLWKPILLAVATLLELTEKLMNCGTEIWFLCLNNYNKNVGTNRQN